MKFIEDSFMVDEQPTWRLWGEEKMEGAIFSVYLKKVRYHTPSRSLNSDDEDSISHLEWETVRIRFIKAGTLEKLVEFLASDTGELESTYVNVFLATYRTFASAKQVLNLLTERYEQLGKMECPRELVELNRRTLRQALHVWLDNFPDDFIEPPNFPCLSQFENFCRRVMPGSELDAKIHRKGLQLRKEASLRDSPLIQHLLDTAGPRSPHLGLHQTSHPTTRYSGKTQSLPMYTAPPYGDLLDIPVRTVAHQLTAMDNELFKRVIPHQCLGSVWSRRDKSRDRDAATVVATIDQFNAVSHRVISTVLMDLEAKASQRAKVITAWVEVAQELRILKNFSSLKAIISGLQSNPVYRLKKPWSMLAREKLEVFEELAKIFSEENNAVAQRELLVREGTAKFADTAGEDDHHLQRVLQKHQDDSRQAISYGTIPYLGTFLTDLTMIDTAIPDIVSSGLINFDKRRKEFEVLAQIKLLQGAANAYTIERDARFAKWFESVPVMDEVTAFEVSCQIEPGQPSANSSTGKESRFRRRIGGGVLSNHRKNDSIASTVSGSSSSSTPMLCETDGSLREDNTSASINDSVRSRVSSASSASLPSIDTSLASANSPTKCDKNSSSLSCQTSETSTTFPQTDPYRSPDFYIIRVSLESSVEATEGVIMYKSIMLSNREHTREVICSAMMKHGLEGSPEDFTLSQFLPEKELLIPPNANVYYAINTQHDLNFVLRKKKTKEEEKEEALFKNSTPGRRTRDTSKARRKLLGLAL